MATTTKNRSKTSVKIKKPIVSEPKIDDGDQEADLEIKPGKTKPIEIDEPEPIVSIDEKVEEDPLAMPTDEDDSADEISLDGEEINPFGDRWEE